MEGVGALVKALGVSYAAGVNLYATIAVLGLAERLHWIAPLPGALGAVDSVWIIALAAVLYTLEFVATLVPGLASFWETVHTFIRPPAAAVLAAATVWGGGSTVTLAAALLGGGLALTTHGAKLGARYAIDASPEPFSNGAANLAELGVVSTLLITLWQHPVITLSAALVLLVLLLLAVRAVWRGARRALSRIRLRPARDRDAVSRGRG